LFHFLKKILIEHVHVSIVLQFCMNRPDLFRGEMLDLTKEIKSSKLDIYKRRVIVLLLLISIENGLNTASQACLICTI
jgi:hypothetical protein